MSLKSFQKQVADAIRSGRKPPPADTFDPDTFPFGKAPGDNKFGTNLCMTCGKPPTKVTGNHYYALPDGAFLFRDQLSAREYVISGMCQSCQDGVFGRGEE